jgi:hypothetical protein
MDAEKKERNIISQFFAIQEMANLSDEVLKLMKAINDLNNNDEFNSVKNIKFSLYKLCKHIDINFNNINIKDHDY